MATIFIRSKSDSVINWTTEDVKHWLIEIGLSKHAKRFQKSFVTGPVLLQLDESLLDDLYIIKSQDRQVLLYEAEKLSNSYNKTLDYVQNDNIDQDKQMNQPLSSSKKTSKTFCTTEIRLNGRKISLNSDEGQEVLSPSKDSSFTNVREEEPNVSCTHMPCFQDKPNDRKHIRFKANQSHTDEKANKEEDKKENYQGEDNKAEQVVSRATQMVELLSEENSVLRQELENYYTRIAQAEQVSLELEKMEETYRELEVSSSKREVLENSMRARLESELRKLQESNKSFKDKLETSQFDLAEAKKRQKDVETLNQVIKRKDSIVRQLKTKENETEVVKDQLKQTVLRHQLQVENMTAEIQQLNNVVWQNKNTITKLEERLKKKDSYFERMAVLQKALEKNIKHHPRIISVKDLSPGDCADKPNSTDEGVAELDGPTSIPILIEMIREKDDRIMTLEVEVAKLEQRFRQECKSRHLAIKAVSMPKEARIAALERAVEESERVLTDTRSQNLMTIEKLYVANRRVADLEAEVKSLHVQLEQTRTFRFTQEAKDGEDETAHSDWCTSSTSNKSYHTQDLHTQDLSPDLTELESFDSGMSNTNERFEKSIEQMSLLSKFRFDYGKDGVKKLRRLKSTGKQIARFKNHLRFCFH